MLKNILISFYKRQLNKQGYILLKRRGNMLVSKSITGLYALHTVSGLRMFKIGEYTNPTDVSFAYRILSKGGDFTC